MCVQPTIFFLLSKVWSCWQQSGKDIPELLSSSVSSFSWGILRDSQTWCLQHLLSLAWSLLPADSVQLNLQGELLRTNPDETPKLPPFDAKEQKFYFLMSVLLNLSLKERPATLHWKLIVPICKTTSFFLPFQPLPMAHFLAQVSFYILVQHLTGDNAGWSNPPFFSRGSSTQTLIPHIRLRTRSEHAESHAVMDPIKPHHLQKAQM